MHEHDVTNVGVSNAKAEASVGDYLKRLLSRITGPLPVLGGSALPSREGLPGRPVLGVNADEELLQKTKHLRHKNETMMAFFARTFIGAHAIRNSSRAELDRMYAVVTSNPDYRENQETAALSFEPKPPKTRFILT